MKKSKGKPYSHFPHASGVYRLIAPDGRFYIGSSVDVFERSFNHFRLMRRGKAPVKIQSAWDSFGGVGGLALWRAEVLEFCPVEEMLEKEAEWIEKLGSAKMGLNTSRNGRGGGAFSSERKAKFSEDRKRRFQDPEWRWRFRNFTGTSNPRREIWLVSPDGTETRLLGNRTEFCKEIGACWSAFKDCVYNKKKSHVKGWALPETPRTIIYGPDGKQYSFVSKIIFRRIHGPIDIQGLLNGEIASSRGWSMVW